MHIDDICFNNNKYIDILHIGASLFPINPLYQSTYIVLEKNKIISSDTSGSLSAITRGDVNGFLRLPLFQAKMTLRKSFFIEHHREMTESLISSS